MAPRPDPRLAALEAATASEERMPDEPAKRQAFAAAQSQRFFERWGEPGPRVAQERFAVPVDGFPAVEALVLWPTAERNAPEEGLPVYLHLYGGAFQIGSIDDPLHVARGARLAAEAECIVVLGSYSLVPDARFPTQPEQACALLDWTVEHAPELGGDPERVAIGGASAGANLAAAATIMRRDRGGSRIRSQILEVPMVDMTMRSLDARGLTRTPGMLVRGFVRRLLADYIDRRDRRDRRASPLMADLADLPDALILTAELDPLRGDGESYAHALMEAGVPTTCIRLIGQTHFGGGHTRFVPSAAFAHEAIVRELRRLHEPPRTWPTAEEAEAQQRARRTERAPQRVDDEARRTADRGPRG